MKKGGFIKKETYNVPILALSWSTKRTLLPLLKKSANNIVYKLQMISSEKKKHFNFIIFFCWLRIYFILYTTYIFSETTRLIELKFYITRHRYTGDEWCLPLHFTDTYCFFDRFLNFWDNRNQIWHFVSMNASITCTQHHRSWAYVAHIQSFRVVWAHLTPQAVMGYINSPPQFLRAGAGIPKFKVLWGCETLYYIFWGVRVRFVYKEILCFSHGNNKKWPIESLFLMPTENIAIYQCKCHTT